MSIRRIVRHSGATARLSRRAALRRVGGAAVAAAGATTGWSGTRASAQGTPPTTNAGIAGTGHQVYFGWLLGSNDIAAIAIDVGPLNDAGAWNVRAYACDGFGLPSGMAVWFVGAVDKATVERKREGVSLTSPTGQETLVIGHLDDYTVAGSFTGADGRVLRYDACRAIDGAGIYDVVLDDTLRYHGMSSNGSELIAQANEHGLVTGTISTAEGQEIPFEIMVLALCPPEELSKWGLPTGFTQFAANSTVPDTYVALISPGGTFWLGRSGDIRAGSPGANIIGLDHND